MSCTYLVLCACIDLPDLRPVALITSGPRRLLKPLAEHKIHGLHSADRLRREDWGRIPNTLSHYLIAKRIYGVRSVLFAHLVLKGRIGEEGKPDTSSTSSTSSISSTSGTSGTSLNSSTSAPMISWKVYS
jgi:hypothetical protein